MSEHAPPGQTGGVVQLWGRTDFRRLLLGQGISGLGDWMATVALMALVLDITGSSTAVGGVLVLRLAPTVVSGPIATRIVHRWDRRRTMLAMDLARAGIALAIPWVRELWWVYLWAFLLEVGGLVFLPARDAAVPDLVEADDDLSLANGLVLGSSYGTIPLGAGAFGAIAAITGSPVVPVFVADAVTFLLSFWFVLRIERLQSRRQGQEDEGEDQSEEHTGGFLEAFSLPLVRRVAPMAATVALGLGALFSLGIVYVRDVLGASTAEFGVLVALFGVGAALGLAALHALGRRDLDTVTWMVAAQGITVAGMSLAPAIGFAFLGAVLFGAATAATLTGAMSVLQEAMGGEERVMAFTVFHVIIRGGLAVAAIGAGAAADLLAPVHWPAVGRLEPSRVVLFSSGVLVLVTAIVSRAALRGRLDEGAGAADATSAGG